MKFNPSALYRGNYMVYGQKNTRMQFFSEHKFFISPKYHMHQHYMNVILTRPWVECRFCTCKKKPEYFPSPSPSVPSILLLFYLFSLNYFIFLFLLSYLSVLYFFRLYLIWNLYFLYLYVVLFLATWFYHSLINSINQSINLSLFAFNQLLCNIL